MTEPNKTVIELSAEEAGLFLWMQQNYDKIMILKESEVFEQKNGSVTLHFDNTGSLMQVESNEIRFKRQRIISGAIVKI